MSIIDSENIDTSSSPLKTPKEESSHKDIYCFECHRDGDDVINCVSCPRAYHSTCLHLIRKPERDWTCPECEITQSSFDIIYQSIPLQISSKNEFQIILKYALRRLKAHPQADHFMQTSDYFDCIVHPMDLKTIESNLQRKKYSSTEAFLSDMKWMLHNCIIQNGNQSELTHTARTLLRIARQEMTEIETCSECYLHSAQAISADWFTKPCTVPHTLCWAKMKTHQVWPAKILRVTNGEVDVRFFGKHDRAWISINDCFVLSKDYPDVQRKKTTLTLKKSLDELQSHIDQLKKLYGHFTYAPLYTAISKTKAFRFVSIIDDSILPHYMTVGNKFHSFKKDSKQKRSNEDLQHQKQSTKRIRISTDENQFQSNLNVFDIFDQVEPSSMSMREKTTPPSSNSFHSLSRQPSALRSSSPTNNRLRIQALLRKYTDCNSAAVDPVRDDIRLSMNGLLDAVEMLQSVSNLPKQPSRRKNPRKSNLQHRVIQANTHSNFLTCTSIPFVPLRPISVSPPRVDGPCEDLPCVPNEIIPMDVLSVKSDSTDNEQTRHIQRSETNISLPTTIPHTHSYSPISEANHWPSILSIDSPIRPPKSKTHSRKRSPRHSANSEQLRDYLQTTITHFSDRFQELLVNFTDQIEQSLESTRMQYEKDLEETRRSHQASLNDLHAITTEHIHEIHNDLEVQYLQRLSEMRRRYESKLQYD